MAEILIFPDRKRAIGQAEAQRKWLETNGVPITYGWSWPKSTWMSRRLEIIRNSQNKRHAVEVI